MYLSELTVEGYGGLESFHSGPLSPGLVVVHGPNEAGKSTLMDFLTSILFGFPSRRADPRFRAPVSNSRHGGRVAMVTGPGDGEWSVERFASPHKSLAIRRPDGSEAAPDDLQRLLGHADEALFRAVFAVDLTELGSADALGRDSVRELLFSASIVGQRRSAARAMDSLARQRAEIARLRQADARVNRLLAQLEPVRRAIAEATRAADAFPSRAADIARLEASIEADRASGSAAAERDRELEALLRLATVLERQRSAEAELDGLGVLGADQERLIEHADAIRTLRDQASGHRERLDQQRGLLTQRETNEQKISEALGELGPSWDRERIAATSGWVALAYEAHDHQRAMDKATTELRARQAMLAELGPPPAAPSPGGPDPAQVDGAREQLRELRQNLEEQTRLAAQIRAEEQSAALQAPEPARPNWLLVAVFTAILAGAVAGAGLSSGHVAVLAVCVALVVLSAVGLVGALRPGRAGGTTASKGEAAKTPDVARTRLERVTARIAELATALELPDAPSASDLETKDRRLDERRRRASADEEQTRRREEAVERLTLAEAAVAAAEEQLVACRSELSSFARAQGLPDNISAEGVVTAIDVVKRASDHVGAVSRIDRALEPLEAAVGDFERKTRSLLADVAPARSIVGGTELASELDAVGQALDDALAEQAARRELERVAHQAVAEIERNLGTGATAERLRRELDEGTPLDWQLERDALAPTLSEANARIEALLRQHQDAVRELEELAASDRIAHLELERSSLEEELEAALEDWTILGLARALLARTLQLHERERQPEVLLRAGERFARVTDGRYVRLLPSLSSEGAAQSIRVVSHDGAELDAAHLSRGTLEQLYLCLRLGLAETFAERGVALPLVLDDVLVNFDPGRAEGIARALASTAASHQVLLLTCHPHLVELVRSVEPGCQVVELARL